MEEPEDSAKSFYLFGRDISKVPCFRSSFLYGISGGFAMGLSTFMLTSRVQMSTHAGFSGFILTTLTYWMYCRYKWSTEKFAITQLQPALKSKAVYEGTKYDPEIREA